MVGCDGDYTKDNFRSACASGWHVATASDYYQYGGKTVAPTKARWIDVAWNSQGKETSLDNWQGFFPLSNNLGSWYTTSYVVPQTNEIVLYKSISCVWVSVNEQCKLAFGSQSAYPYRLHIYGKSYGCHCRGNGINGTHGVVCAKDNEGEYQISFTFL